MQPIRLKLESAGVAANFEAARNALLAVPGVMSVTGEPSRPGEMRVEAAETVTAEQLVEAAQHAGFVATAIG